MTREDIFDIIKKEANRFGKLNESNGKRIARSIKNIIKDHPNVKWCITSFKISESKNILKTGICFHNNSKIVIRTVIKE